MKSFIVIPVCLGRTTTRLFYFAIESADTSNFYRRTQVPNRNAACSCNRLQRHWACGRSNHFISKQGRDHGYRDQAGDKDDVGDLLEPVAQSPVGRVADRKIGGNGACQEDDRSKRRIFVDAAVASL